LNANETAAGKGEYKSIGGPFMPDVQMGDDGVVRIDYRSYDCVTLGVVQQAYEKQLAVSREEQRPVLIFGQSVMSLDKDVARFVAGKEVKSLTKAAAILTKSFVEEQTGNMYLMFNAPPFPTRLFTSETAALRWLTGYVV
jgi:hypothetical protein